MILPNKYQIQSSTKARNNYDVITFRMYEDIRQLLGKLLTSEFDQHGSTKKTSRGQMLRQLADECREFYNFVNQLSNLCDCRCTKNLVCMCSNDSVSEVLRQTWLDCEVVKKYGYENCRRKLNGNCCME